MSRRALALALLALSWSCAASQGAEDDCVGIVCGPPQGGTCASGCTDTGGTSGSKGGSGGSKGGQGGSTGAGASSGSSLSGNGGAPSMPPATGGQGGRAGDTAAGGAPSPAGGTTSTGGFAGAQTAGAAGAAGDGGSQGTAGQSGAFWRVERPADSKRWWLVSPSGERVFNLGVNTVMRDANCQGIKAYITRKPPTESAHTEWARLSTGSSGGVTVDNPFCFNNVGAFSDTNDFDDSGGDSHMIRPASQGGAGAPYSVVLNVAAADDAHALRDASGAVLLAGVSGPFRVGDPFHPAFAAHLSAMAKAVVAPRRDDPALQMWFAGNETGIFDRATDGIAGVYDLRRYLYSDCPQGSSIDAPACAPHALIAFLRERHGSIAALDDAWQSTYAAFDDIVGKGPRPVPYDGPCNLTCRQDLQIFVHDRLRRSWIDVVTQAIRSEDPNHLVSTPRLAVSNPSRFKFWRPASQPDPDVWAENGVAVPTDTAEVVYSPFDLFTRQGDRGFDLVSFNIYTGEKQHPEAWLREGFERIAKASKLPLYVSEFSVRARLPGWTNKGGFPSFVPDDDATDDQIQRGAYYREQVRQFIGFESLVGVTWHAYSDRFTPSSEQQINMGLVQCDDPSQGLEAGKRWTELADRVSAINCDIEAEIEAITGL